MTWDEANAYLETKPGREPGEAVIALYAWDWAEIPLIAHGLRRRWPMRLQTPRTYHGIWLPQPVWKEVGRDRPGD